jgi:enoyl-CoA hydratase/carnithine racemase
MAFQSLSKRLCKSSAVPWSPAWTAFQSATYRIGIFNKVVSSERLMEEVLTYARRLADGPSQALGYSKLAVYQVAALSLNDGLRAEEFAKL